ncbi:MAG: M55 family metallopeptidase [Candidatus Obscuribacterales bacterium]|nr:M55 family metallopeptidase [Cyanobacteria bacterium SZAS LIN-5]
MRIYLSVDLEGVNGVLHSSQTQPGEPGYERAVGLMHRETNAIIEGLRKGGASHVLVNDSHFDMRNLRIEQLAPKASLINGWQKPYSMVSGAQYLDDEKVDAACFVGYHARAGSQRGVLSHTYRATVFLDVKLNGQSVGETGLNAALCGYFGIPVMLLTGDDVVCEEARELLGPITCIQTKKAVSRYSAECPPFEETLAALQSGAEKAIKDKRSWQLFKPPSPSTMRITMIDPAMADAAELLPQVRRVDGRQIEFSDSDYAVLFKLMLAVGVLGASRKDPHF